MKSWKNKILPALLAGTLTFSFGTAVNAENNGNGKGHGKSKVQKVKVEKQIKLKDVQNHWAQRTVELMSTLQIIKGYEDATFRPQNTVTQAEAIVMVVRLLGLEDDTVIQGNSSLSFGNVPFWAKGSIQYAVQEGIISSKESLQPNKAATRLFVTKLLVNALGAKLGEDGEKASLFFNDVEGLSNSDRSYLTFAILQSLVKGYGDKSFQPNKPVTRAEMAVFIERLKEYKEDHGDAVDNSLTGTIDSIDDDSLTIEKNGKDTSYDVDDDVRVYIDKKASSYSSLKEGMKIRVALQDDGEVGFIDAFTSDNDDEDDTDAPDLGWMEEIKEFKAELSDDDKTVEIYFKPGSNDYEAKIEVTNNSGTRSEIKGNTALLKIEQLLKEAGMKDEDDRFDEEDFIKAVADAYDLEDEVDVELELSVGSKEYEYNDTYDLDEEEVELGDLTLVKEFDLSFDSADKDVVYHFEKDSNSYEASIKVTEDGKTSTTSGVRALSELKALQELFTEDDDAIDLNRVVNWVDNKYDLEGNTKIKGSVKIGSSTYSLDKEVDLGGK